MNETSWIGKEGKLSDPGDGNAYLASVLAWHTVCTSRSISLSFHAVLDTEDSGYNWPSIRLLYCRCEVDKETRILSPRCEDSTSRFLLASLLPCTYRPVSFPIADEPSKNGHQPRRDHQSLQRPSSFHRHRLDAVSNEFWSRCCNLQCHPSHGRL